MWIRLLEKLKYQDIPNRFCACVTSEKAEPTAFISTSNEVPALGEFESSVINIPNFNDTSAPVAIKINSRVKRATDTAPISNSNKVPNCVLNLNHEKEKNLDTSNATCTTIKGNDVNSSEASNKKHAPTINIQQSFINKDELLKIKAIKDVRQRPPEYGTRYASTHMSQQNSKVLLVSPAFRRPSYFQAKPQSLSTAKKNLKKLVLPRGLVGTNGSRNPKVEDLGKTSTLQNQTTANTTKVSVLKIIETSRQQHSNYSNRLLVRSAKSDCDLQWSRPKGLYSQSRLLYRLVSKNSFDSCLNENVSEDESLLLTHTTATSMNTTAIPEKNRFNKKVPEDDIQQHCSLRRLHSSGSQWTIAGTNITPKLISRSSLFDIATD